MFLMTLPCSPTLKMQYTHLNGNKITCSWSVNKAIISLFICLFLLLLFFWSHSVQSSKMDTMSQIIWDDYFKTNSQEKDLHVFLKTISMGMWTEKGGSTESNLTG